MNAKLQALIDAAQELSPLEKLDLIAAVSQSLYRAYQQTQPAADFWSPKPLEQLIQSQPVTDIADLRADFWPEDESADDLIDYIYKQREEDRLRAQ